MRDPQCILITGASSGIGAALAKLYAGPGRTLALTARNEARLEEVAARCRWLGADVLSASLDVRDAGALAGWIAEVERQRPIDLGVANAGVALGANGADDSAEAVRLTFATNVDGVLNTVLPLMAPMRQRRRGQIAIVSSVASFRGFPGSAAYCASKAAERLYGEGLRGDLAPFGVGVSVICPGFIRTPMTAANPFAMPLLMEPERAAAIIRHGLARNRARIAFPWPTYAVCWLLGVLPPSWTDGLLRRGPRKS
ncbi:MAG: SDR family NAD(P)-dependent oxidoreductase [Rhodospirillaceae bacterium]